MEEGYLPVKKLALEGVQIGHWEYALSNATPESTSLSKLGVSIFSFPSE